jgi:hypothetical protein
VFGALARFVGSCDDLTVMMTVPEFGCLQEVQGSFILGDGWSQQRSRPRIVGSQPEWEECRPSDLGGVRSPLVWDIG